jgi:hypothetical protein
MGLEGEISKHIYRLHKNNDRKMRTLVLKTHIFGSKTPNLTLKSVSGAPRVTLFSGGSELQPFATML